MRIGVGQLWQETNTFNPLPTRQADFESFGITKGSEMVATMAHTNELGGFIQSLSRWPETPEVIGLIRLPAWPSGTATAATFSWLRSEMLEALRRAGPLDGLLLALHGAMVAEGTPDVEGAILESIREVLGPAIPIVATLDLHANVTQTMVRCADALVLYHTAPHIDVYETGERGAAVLRRILVDKMRPVTAFQKIPAVVPAERANTQDPASVSHSFHAQLQALERDPAILAAGLATVQPWLDIPELGSAVVVVTCGDATRAKHEATRLSREFWEKRQEYLPDLTSLEEAVRLAHAHTRGLVVLSDSADATTSGAPGDSTWLLRELSRYDWPRPVLLTFVAPEVVRAVEQLGLGAEFAGLLGGVRDHRFSKPLEVRAQVERLFAAQFVMSGHLARNMTIDMGPSAVLRIRNMHLVVTSRSGPHFAPQLFECAGMDPFQASVLVAKSPCGFRAAYASRAARILVVRAPGCAPSDFWNYPYHQRPQPLWPWDEIAHWEPEPHMDP